jgi:hypothetical protein
MSMTESIDWIHYTYGFRSIAAESESDLRLENSAKATILSFRELEKTKRRSIIYFRQITRKIWKETRQRDQMSNMSRRNAREVVSLCETEAAPTCQSSSVYAAVLCLRGGGGILDTVPNGNGGPQKSSLSPSSPSLQEVEVVEESQTALDVYESQCQEAVSLLRDTVSRAPTAMQLAQDRANATFFVNPVGNVENVVARSVPLLPPTNINPRRVSVSTNGPVLPAGRIAAANNKADHKSQVLGKTSVFSIIPDYQHSVYIHTKERKHIQDKFLLHSVEGVIRKAAELNLKLLPNIISSLHNNGGQFIQFTSITGSLSPQAKKFLESNSESPEEYDQQNNTQGPKHVALSESARFGDRVGVRAANDSKDLIRKLCTFCAIKGDYESMMIMLETPPAHTPPIDPITICQFVNHRMAPPGTPLFVDFTTETVPLLDIFNNPIHAQGVCRSLDGMKHTYVPLPFCMRNTVTLVHIIIFALNAAHI